MLERRVVKARGITPHTKHPWKRVSNANARAYLTLLQSMSGRRTRMYTTAELKTRLSKEHEELTRARRAVTGNAELRVGVIDEL